MVIHKDEIAKVVITWLMVLLLSIGYTIGWSAVHSMLVKRMGVEYLPYTYIGISLLGVFGSSVYLMFADMVRRDRLLMIFSLVTAIMLLLARTLVATNQADEKGISIQLVLFFVVVFFAQGVGNSTLGTQVWTIINDLFRPSQGRRLYPIVGTAGTIGGIAGGFSIHFLANSFGTPNLVFVWAGAILILIPLTWWLRKLFGGELLGKKAGSASVQPAASRLLEGWTFFRSSQMAVTLGFIAIMFWIVGSLADFQFTRIMNASFSSEAELAGFYGFYGMMINITGLVLQIFIGSYLIRRIGVSRGLCALPLTVLAGFGLIASFFTFYAGLFLRTTWDMVASTLQGNSYQLALGVIPGALRARVRGFIDGVINPLGGILGGLIILLLNRTFTSSNVSGWHDPVTLCGFALASLWIIVVARSQKHYIGMIADNLRSNEQRTVMDAIDCLVEPGTASADTMLDEVASMSDPIKRAAVARVRCGITGKKSLQALYGTLNDPVAHVRAEALHSITHLLRKRSLPTEAFDILRRVIESDPEPAIRVDALKLVLADSLKLLLLKKPNGEWQKMAQRLLQNRAAPVRRRVVEAIGILNTEMRTLLNTMPPATVRAASLKALWDEPLMVTVARATLLANTEMRALLEPMLSDESAVVRAATAQALWDEPEMRTRARATLAALIEENDPEARRAALVASHLVADCPDLEAATQKLTSPDAVSRILAKAAIIRFSTNTKQKEEAITVLRDIMADESNCELLQEEIVPLLPSLGEEAADEILFTVARLAEEKRAHATNIINHFYDVLNNRVSLGEIMKHSKTVF